MKSGNLNFLEPSGPLQACNGTALTLPFYVYWEPCCSMRTNGLTEGQNDMTKLTEAFRNFANAPKNRKILAILFHSSKGKQFSSHFPTFLLYPFPCHTLTFIRTVYLCLSILFFFQLSIHTKTNRDNTGNVSFSRNVVAHGTNRRTAVYMNIRWRCSCGWPYQLWLTV